MRSFFLLIISLFLGINSVFAYELVLPKEKKTFVKTNYAFFVGQADKDEILTINDEKVYIASNGAFAHSIKLKDGENRIAIKSNYNTQIYKFIKENNISKTELETIDFDPKLFKVKKDNVPLRKTPIDFGMNRISHLFKDTYLLINGEKGCFYRVLLGKNNEAWIDKSYVKEASEIIFPSFIAMNSATYKNASKHSITFTDNLPYSIIDEEDEILFKVYNPLTTADSIYTINIRKPEKYFYETSLKDGKYNFKITELPKTENNLLQGLNITIDAGHGGDEKGAIGCLGHREKDINLEIALCLQNILKEYGANVIMTRENDNNVSLDERVEIAKENDTHIFLSIHLNSIPDIKMDVHKNKGTSVYYYNPNSKDLAQTVNKYIVDGIGTRNDGVRTASFAVIRPTEYIGILVEVAYMTNPIDSVLYTKESFAQKAAKSIADGILNYANSSL